MKNFDKEFKLQVNVDGDKATARLQTPTQALSSAKITVEKKGADEYELKTERNSALEMNMHATIRLQTTNRLFRVQVLQKTRRRE